ncbi:hypothetical protein CALVIDRAFT_231294 [Calocera viscosa TUFC12733]|uniref:Uncharacterized protein n=1 Tax=Calocera viscosa (strain TUFC12733) TaxID=1330018 RepID=A0A167JX72_CALVF|nr:hypothetical protein CALVIDRAFT_231294 [Calocera viscosa TUFC12733]
MCRVTIPVFRRSKVSRQKTVLEGPVAPLITRPSPHRCQTTSPWRSSSALLPPASFRSLSQRKHVRCLHHPGTAPGFGGNNPIESAPVLRCGQHPFTRKRCALARLRGSRCSHTFEHLRNALRSSQFLIPRARPGTEPVSRPPPAATSVRIAPGLRCAKPAIWEARWLRY